MKKLLLLVAVVAMLLPSCKEIEGSIDALDNYINKLEDETIPTIDEQIAAINVSLDALDTTDKELKGYIDGLQATADNLQEQINATNTKIDEVKAALQGEISTAKAEVLAELEALETELKNELSQINATIETLKAKDEELDQKIADLRSYVDTELGKTTDWVNATFATLEQYNALVAEVTAIKAQIVAINESIADLETRLTTKINEDIANAVSTLNSTIQQKVSEITTAYTEAVKAAKDEVTKAYTAAIATAISNLETSLKSWVSEQLSNYYTIAQVDVKIANLEKSIADGKKVLQEELDALKLQLETVKKELTETYKNAIEEAITKNNGVLDTKITEEIVAVNTRIDNKVAIINSKIVAIEARLDNIEAKLEDLLTRIQSVSYIPKYSDGKATIQYVGDINRVILDFEISPKDAIDELVNVWQEVLSLKAVYTETRTVSFIDMPITKFEADTANGVISITASGENLSTEFFAGTQEASTRLAISDGNSSVTSDYIPIIASNEVDIYSIEDLVYITNNMPSASMNLKATLDMIGVDWIPISKFSGVFNGNSDKGYEIKNLSAPLFNKMTGEVKNLKISANITNITSRGAGALVCTLGEGGTISNCEVSGKIEVTVSGTQLSGTSYIAGVAGYALETSTITNTTNNCAITICSTEAVDSNIFIGGILGYKYSNVGLTIDNCCNNGEIIFDVITSKSVYLGGVVAEPRSNTIIKGNIANNGNILFNGSCKTLYMGGVFAKLNISATFSEDCTIVNSGTLCNNTPDLWNRPSNCGTSETAYIGGIIGSNSSTSIAGYTVNIGDLLFQNLSATTQYIGGIVGNTTKSIVGAKCYCGIDMSDDNFTNVGWIMGNTRTDTIQALNCSIGGYTLEYSDEYEGFLYNARITPDNFFDYIYGSGKSTDWSGTENYDGCTYLTEKPTIAQL